MVGGHANVCKPFGYGAGDVGAGSLVQIEIHMGVGGEERGQDLGQELGHRGGVRDQPDMASDRVSERKTGRICPVRLRP